MNKIATFLLAVLALCAVIAHMPQDPNEKEYLRIANELEVVIEAIDSGDNAQALMRLKGEARYLRSGVECSRAHH